jgi:4-hydroxy-tetrahydrodipicolinate synthase
MSKTKVTTTIASGIWPTMITPYTTDNKIDYPALEQLIEWYVEQGVDGLFAVCQSSEMFMLSLEERIQLAAFVQKQAKGRVQVIASGHVSDHLTDQIEEIKRISATGIDAFVMVSNRLARADESEQVWQENAEKILQQVPDIPFGIYECPYPYKRLLSPELLRWCADSGRFLFLKDTSCDLDQIEAKLNAVRGSNLKLFNANAATLLDSLRLGASGFSGVMANFHPDLYTRLWEMHKHDNASAEQLQQFLGLSSAIERQYYPVNAKYYQQLIGLPTGLNSRSLDPKGLTSAMKMELGQLQALSQFFRDINNA